jgi:hypothetical protein
MTDGTNRKHLFKNSFFLNQLVLILKQDLTILFNVIQWFILLLTFIAFIVYLFFFLIAKITKNYYRSNFYITCFTLLFILWRTGQEKWCSNVRKWHHIFFLNSSSSYIGPSTLIYKSNNNRFKNIVVYFQLFWVLHDGRDTKSILFVNLCK